MADITAGEVKNPIDKGLLQTEVISQSAVAKLAGLSVINFGETQVYHVFEETNGVSVGEGEVKPETGAGIGRLEVNSTKFVKRYSYTLEAISGNEALFNQLLDVQTKSLAKTYDQAVLGLVTVNGITFDSFNTGATEVEITSASDFWNAWATASAVSEADGVLLTAGILGALRGQYNQLGQPVHDIQGDTLEGTINGIPYAVVRGVADKFGIIGPWKSRAVAALGNALNRVNPWGDKYFDTNTIGAIAEIAGGFRVVDKAEFVKFTIGAPVDPEVPTDPEVPHEVIWDGEIEVQNLENQEAEYLKNGILAINGNNAEVGGTLELFGTMDIDGVETEVSGNLTQYYFNEKSNGLRADFEFGAATNVANVNISGVYTAPENNEPDFNFNGNTVLTYGEGEKIDANTFFDAKTGMIEFSVGEEFAGMNLTLSGFYEVDGAATYELSESTVIEESGIAYLTTNPLVGEIINWEVSGNIS